MIFFRYPAGLVASRDRYEDSICSKRHDPNGVNALHHQQMIEWGFGETSEYLQSFFSVLPGDCFFVRTQTHTCGGIFTIRRTGECVNFEYCRSTGGHKNRAWRLHRKRLCSSRWGKICSLEYSFHLRVRVLKLLHARYCLLKLLMVKEYANPTTVAVCLTMTSHYNDDLADPVSRLAVACNFIRCVLLLQLTAVLSRFFATKPFDRH